MPVTAAPIPLRTPPPSSTHSMAQGTGSVTPGTVGEFPGADLPFGMIQWSPDTTPNAVQSGGGYDVSDSSIGGLQPHPPERHRVPVLPGRPHPPHRRSGGRRPRVGQPALLAPKRGGSAGPLPGGAESGTEPDRREPRRHHPYRHRAGHLPAGRPVQPPLQGGREHQPGLGRPGPHRRRRRGGGTGHQRPVLRDGQQLHGALRGPVRASLHRATAPGRRRAVDAGEAATARARVAAPTSASTRTPPMPPPARSP